MGALPRALRAPPGYFIQKMLNKNNRRGGPSVRPFECVTGGCGWRTVGNSVAAFAG
jgi:hypothetical protein